ncbi:5870_t:CDS:1 [Acaulospora colombiana]|uniref:5870_t:CDS:1 n=1 Tax=Acaulospora colombiana TaxID=27376 RepID=A0ACA9KMD0_9GLOM|nr:5870_t:CDS:1 [Acaulospora colombiana]
MCIDKNYQRRDFSTKRYDSDSPPREYYLSSDSDSKIVPVSLTNAFLEASVEFESILDQTAESDVPRTPPPRQAQIRFNSEDNDLHDQDENENASNEVQDLIAKMKNAEHRLFEYRIVNLSEESLVDPINSLFG